MSTLDRRRFGKVLLIVSYLGLACAPTILGSMHRPVRPDDFGMGAAMADWKEQYHSGWWPWGLVALDHDSDGAMDLLISQHNGGSRILRNDEMTFSWAHVESNLGGTYRPLTWDFDNDGSPDLAYRDSTSNTFYLNTGGKFEPLGFAYGTSEYAIKEIRDFNGDGFLDFGHDYGRWLWNGNGFTKSSYTHPAQARLPRRVRQFLDNEWAKPNNKYLKVWYIDGHDLNGDGRPDVILAGFGAYGGSLFGRYLVAGENGSLVDATASLGLPATGTPIYAEDANRDGLADVIIVGQGFYISTERGYVRKPGDVTKFVQSPGSFPHVVYPLTDGLVINNPRGQRTEIYQQTGPGEFGRTYQIPSWDGEPVAVCDLDGDGREDVCVGTGDTVVVFFRK